MISLGLDENDIGNRGLQLLANALNQYLVKNKMASYLSVDSLVQMLEHWTDFGLMIVIYLWKKKKNYDKVYIQEIDSHFLLN